ncbi:MAG: UDP-N-acetylmuramoyl-tripeptide--D-alanyl-D-alanine ligase [Acidimicrobiales bacterium]|nr:UDP-N-acetylmuramoyl-tripeptide--D-alanyl-D-alanine ligase [Acidimicrobiales bacterium]MDG2217699.1 UDP-N-acetylmuramoyl-tripeptide--D-alanyl-D-alanine ligase [Acidimicrobiales bacterium]
MRWTRDELARAVSGDAQGPDVVVEWVTQDSREVADHAGSLFVPVLADRDGHDFIDSAFDAGAVATFASTDVAALGRLVIRVDDTAVALAALGRAARRRLDGADVIAITGSVGKTTTKDFLAAALGTTRRTHASERSFNNEIGVPLTLARAPGDSEVVVLELGARGLGHIAELCAIARPTMGIVTTVGSAHTSEFGTIEAVAEGKGELIEALPGEMDGGVAVLNADVSLVAAMAGRTAASIVTFGAAGDVRAENIALDDELIPSFRVVSPWGNTELRLGARGLHSVDNALAAVAAALALGMAIDDVAAGLAAPVLSSMRMSLGRLTSGARVLDDTYNANPMSVAAALRSLALMSASHRVAVLGVMAELGEESTAEHLRMAALAAELGIRVIAFDAPGYGDGIEHVATIEQAVDALGDLTDDDAVLVKGSRIARLERLVALL